MPPKDESAFRAWYAGQARRLNLDPNPDDPRHYYDWRAAFRSGATADKAGHWPSTHKTDQHPNLIIDGINTRSGKRATAEDIRKNRSTMPSHTPSERRKNQLSFGTPTGTRRPVKSNNASKPKRNAKAPATPRGQSRLARDPGIDADAINSLSLAEQNLVADRLSTQAAGRETARGKKKKLTKKQRELAAAKARIADPSDSPGNRTQHNQDALLVFRQLMRQQ